MEEKNNLYQDLRNDLNWSASTSRSWMRLLFTAPRTAVQRLREGAVSPEYRAKVRRWHASASVTFRRVRITAPILVGASTCLYFTLSKTSLISSVAYGITAGVATHVALTVLPFALLVSVPLLAFILLRALIPGSIPEPDAHEPQVTSNFRTAADGQGNTSETLTTADSQEHRTKQAGDEPDLLADTNRLSPNQVMASKFDGSERPFLLRLLEYDGSVVVHEPAELEIISKWIENVRKAQGEMATLHKAVGRLMRLDGVVGHKALFELGLLDHASYRTTSTPRQNLADIERFEAEERHIEGLLRDGLDAARGNTHQDVFGNGSTSAEHLDKHGEPAIPPGKELKLISPRGHGYIFLTRADLFGREPPPLTCEAIRDIVRGYVRTTNDHKMMRAFNLLKNVGSDPQAYFQSLNRDRGINLEYIEDQLLARQVRDTAAQRLAKCYAECLAAIEKYRDFISHQQMVAALARVVLQNAHRTISEVADKARAARIAARKRSNTNPYVNAAATRVPVKTAAERRAELAAQVQAAIPSVPLEQKKR